MVEPDAEADDLIGRLVDERYRVIEAMASGSMGAVYKGERVPVGKQVAIKFLHAAYSTDSEFLIRFERETRVMSKLAHPNTVSVVDFGVFEGSPYLVMDFVQGRTLRQVLDIDGPFSPMRALGIIRQVVAGLAHAHAQDVVHRDIKPANIMITEEIGTGEHVRILDFGLARLRGNVGRDATQANVVVGTPNYMAPEQTVGGKIDARTDVYSVGVMLFEMIAGERPFNHEDTMSLLGMHRAAPIPKVADRLDRTIILPHGLQDLLDKAMAKLPGDRYQTAMELADAIDEITGAKTPPEPKGKVVHRRRSTPAIGVSTKTFVRGDGDTEAAVASTMIDATSQKAKLPPPSRPPTLLGIGLAVAVLAGGALIAWYVLGGRGDTKKDNFGSAAQIIRPDPVGSDGSNGANGSNDSNGAKNGSNDSDDGSNADVATGSGSADAGSDDGSNAGSGDAAGSADRGSADAGSGSDAAGSDGINIEAIEIDPDPSTATNIAPAAPEADDEAADAPKSEADVEKRVPKKSPPKMARTLHDAVVLVKKGNSELALASLRQLWKKAPKSAYIPFLLGNLYFDKTWWSIAMDHYRTAIKKNSGYRRNPTLIRNIIRMLASSKTRWKADRFLRTNIGKSAVPYLRQAGRSDRNATVRRLAGQLAKAMARR